MTTSRPNVRRATAVAAAVTLIASGATASSASAAGGITCTPTTRTLDTLEISTPLALSPRGHVVAQEAAAGATGGLWLHRPNGTKTAITYANGDSPYGVSDVNSHGSAVGTSGVNAGAIAPGVPWISQGASAATLPDPTRPYLQSKFAMSINGSGAVAGVATNFPFSSPGLTDFLAVPIVWQDSATNPVDLPMPTGVYQVGFDRGQPLISIRNDGSVSAVVEDYNSVGTYLARWATVTSTPTLVEIPHGLTATSVAGRWVAGAVGSDMFVFSPKSAVRLHAANAITSMHVSANGTYSALLGPGSIFGRGLGTARDAIQYFRATDVVGTNEGMAVMDQDVGISVLSCVLGLSDASYVEVTPIALG